MLIAEHFEKGAGRRKIRQNGVKSKKLESPRE
jgi:hypothetical protein